MLLDRAIVRLLPTVPRTAVRRIAGRYIAGERLEDAVSTVQELNSDGKIAMIDVLGEEVAKPYEAGEIVRAYHDVFEGDPRASSLDSNVSVKLTGLGLKLGYKLCRRNLETVVRHAAESGNFVRIDTSTCRRPTTRCGSTGSCARAGLDNVKVAQARLRRTLDDIADLAEPRAERSHL